VRSKLWKNCARFYLTKFDSRQVFAPILSKPGPAGVGLNYKPTKRGFYLLLAGITHACNHNSGIRANLSASQADLVKLRDEQEAPAREPMREIDLEA